MARGDKTVKSAVKKGNKHIFTRVLSIILVLALVSGIFTFRMTDLRLDEDDGYAAQLLLGSTYAQAGRLKRIGMYLNMLAGNLDSETAADIYISRREYDKAVEMLLLAVMESNEADVGRIYIKCGCVYTLAKDYDNALTYLEKGGETTGNADAYMVMAQILTDEGRYKEAAARMDDYMNAVSGTDFDESGTILALRAGAWDAAIEMYTRLYEADADEDNLLMRGYCLWKAGDIQRAYADFEAYEAAGGVDGAAQLIPALDLMKAERYAEAAEMFSRALGGRGTDEKEVLGRLMVCEYMCGDYQSAARDARLYMEAGSNPASGVVSVELKNADHAKMFGIAAAACMYAGMYEEAAEYYALLPDDSTAISNRAVCLMALERFDEALEEIAKLDVPTRRDRYTEAVCLYNLGRYEECSVLLKEILDESRDDELGKASESLLLDIVTKEEQQ